MSSFTLYQELGETIFCSFTVTPLILVISAFPATAV